MATKTASTPVRTLHPSTPVGSSAVPLWQRPDPETGEMIPAFIYLPGHPYLIRFDAKAGVFTTKDGTAIGDSLTFRPLVWRIFEGDLFNLGIKKWAELFFADDKGRICVVSFHGYSVDNLFNLLEPLFYDRKNLADVRLTVRTEKKENTKISPKGTYYIAAFRYEIVSEATDEALLAFVADHPLYRQDTVAGTLKTELLYKYRVPGSDEPEDVLRAAA